MVYLNSVEQKTIRAQTKEIKDLKTEVVDLKAEVVELKAKIAQLEKPTGADAAKKAGAVKSLMKCWT